MFFNIIFVLSILISIVSFAFMDSTFYETISLSAQACVIILFICAIFKQFTKKRKLPTILKLWWWSIVVALAGIAFVSKGNVDVLLYDVRELFIPFVLTYSAYVLLNLYDKNFRNAFIVIGIVSIVVIIYSLNNSGGYVIEYFYREEITKNQSAPCLAQIGITTLILCLNEKSKVLKLFFFCVFILVLIYCIILQSRTALLCLFGLALLVIWKQYKTKTFIFIPFIFIAVVCTFGRDILDILSQSIVGHHDANDIDSLSSGRVSRMSTGWDIFVKYFFFGVIGNEGININSLPLVHMYLLWKLIKYGIIGSIPFLIVYFGVLRKVFRMLCQGWQQYNFTIVCAFVAFFTSLTEYCAPFGPGTSFILGWCLFGQSLRNNPKKNSGLVHQSRMKSNLSE